MTSQRKDELLSAMLDGELDDDAYLAVESLLRERPEAQSRLESFASVDNLLRQTFGEINETPLPQIDVDEHVHATPVWSRSIAMPLAAAASVIMLLGGALIGIMAERFTAPVSNIAATMDESTTLSSGNSSRALDNALETFASGESAKLTLTGGTEESSIVITRTWKLDDGRYCREYEISVVDDSPSEVGVACREKTGQWRVRMRTYPDPKGTLL